VHKNNEKKKKKKKREKQSYQGFTNEIALNEKPSAQQRKQLLE
jgi:hypothetical protein